MSEGESATLASTVELSRAPVEDLADAALVCVAERERLRRIFTIDRRDFSAYRPKRLGCFTVVP